MVLMYLYDDGHSESSDWHPTLQAMTHHSFGEAGAPALPDSLQYHLHSSLEQVRLKLTWEKVHTSQEDGYISSTIRWLHLKKVR